MTEAPFASVPELVAEIAAGRMVVLVDDESRENEGDVILAADHVTPEAINFMARYCRGLICLTDDGTMARLPDLITFAAEHGIKLGTIADLIRHRSRHEHMVEVAGERPMTTPYGHFQVRTYRDHFGGVHLALTLGEWSETDLVPVRVHEPLSVLDLLDAGSGRHSWPLPLALRAIQAEGRGAALLLNAGESSADLLAALVTSNDKPRSASGSPEVELRTYGGGRRSCATSALRA